MDAQVQGSRLPVRTKLFYGIGDVGNALVNSAVQFVLMIFYTDAALLAPALVGSALLVGKIWDAINEPLFGWVSDRTGSRRFGKRRDFYVPNVAQTSQTLLGIRLFFGLVPGVLIALALPFLIWYPITRRAHEQDVARVYAWIDRTRVIPTKYVDALATIMFQFKAPRRYCVQDFAHTPDMVMDSI